MNIPSGVKRGLNTGAIHVGKGRGSLHTMQSTKLNGGRLDGEASEPLASNKSTMGFKGRIVWTTPTTSAPISRISYVASGDIVPTVTPLSSTQQRIATIIEKKRFIKSGGGRYAPNHQTPALYNSTYPSETGSNVKKGNMGSHATERPFSAIIQPPNQEDISIYDTYPNPIEPLPATNPVDQQDNHLSNFRGGLRIPMRSKNIPILSRSRGFDRNLDGMTAEGGPFDTAAEAERLAAITEGIRFD